MYFGRKARPMTNRICKEKEESEAYRKHKERLRRIKSSVDTKTPRMFKAQHLRVNRKREVMLEERYTEIERANKLLLKRMSNILNGPAPTEMRRKAPGPIPSNKGLRRRELARITEENQAILKRIQESSATYNSAVWEEEALIAHRRMERLCYHKPGALARSASTAYTGARKTRPASAPIHRRASAGALGDIGAPDAVGAVSRQRPSSAHPAYATRLSAWRNEEEKAEVVRGLQDVIAEVDGEGGYDDEEYPEDGPIDLDDTGGDRLRRVGSAEGASRGPRQDGGDDSSAYRGDGEEKDSDDDTWARRR